MNDTVLAVGLCLASNLVLMRLPERVLQHRAFDLVLVTLDITLTTVGLWLCGNAGPSRIVVVWDEGEDTGLLGSVTAFLLGLVQSLISGFNQICG